MEISNTSGRVYLVRCPKCSNILQQPSGVTVYDCGGCGSTLRAKIRGGDAHDASVSATLSSDSVLRSPRLSQSRHLGSGNVASTNAPASTPDSPTSSRQGAGTTSQSKVSNRTPSRKHRVSEQARRSVGKGRDHPSATDKDQAGGSSVPPVDRVTYSPNLRVPGHLETILQDQSSRPHDIPLQYSKEITDNFSDEVVLGQASDALAPRRLMEVWATSGGVRYVRCPMCHGLLREPSAVYICGGCGTILKVRAKIILETILQDQSSRARHIPLQCLKEITRNFSDERILGQGGFGVVYKGVLENGKMIAVKKIVSSLMPGLQKQFESEVYHLMMLKHPNIVRCLGYCYEIRNECLEYNGKYVFAEMAERLLCLEYLPKGSLDKYLSDESSGLQWSTRYKIIEGICYGLCHLHEQTDQPIIHLDLKPANILLDDSLVPKITDFGLSRLLSNQQTICTSSRDGTFGYMAPEFLHGGTITPKSDIFSLGVIILEVVTGHRDYPGITRTSSDDFIKLALEKWRNVLQRSPGYGSLETACEQVKRCIQVGLICVNPDRAKRPPITKVINMLQGWESIDYDTSKVQCN